MSAYEKKGALVLTRRPLISVGIALCGAALATAAAMLCKGTGIPPILPFLLVYFSGLVGAVFAQQRWRRQHRGPVRADMTGLWVAGRCLAERRMLRRGDIVRTPNGIVVRLVRRGLVSRDIDVPVESEEEAKSILQSLRLDSGSSVADYLMLAGTAGERLGKGIGFLGAYLGIIAADFGWFIGSHPAPGALSGPLAVFFAIFIVATTVLASAFGLLARNETFRVSVGTDGVRLRTRVKTTFHPFATIAGATTNGHEVVLAFVDGTQVTIHNPGGGKLAALSDQKDDAHHLVARIREQLATYREEATTDATSLARNGRSAEEWIRDGSALRESKATFRTNVIPTDQLWRIVEDPTASVSARAGAALALRHDLDEPGRVRLRIAADACAAPSLRVALETVAEGDLHDEEALLEAFEPVADAPRRAVRA